MASSTADERAPLLGGANEQAASNGKLLNGSRTPPHYTSPQPNPSSTTEAASTDHDGDLAETERADKEANLLMMKLIVPLGLGVLLSAMDQTIIVSSFASIGSEFNQLQSTSWVATGYMLTLTSFQPLYGKLSDIFGRKECLLFAYAIFAIGCLLCGLARNMPELIAARALAGLGGGGMPTVVTILVSDIVPLRSRGAWQGVLNLIFATGSSIGAPLGGVIADTIGWRWSFYIQVPLAFLAFVIVYFTFHLPKKDVPSDLATKLRRVDFLGAFTLVTCIFCLLFGLDRGSNVSWASPWTIGCLCVSAITMLLFAFVETRVATEPFAPARVFTDRGLLAGYFCNLFSIGGVMAVIFYFSLYIQAAMGMNAAQAGLGLLPAVFGSVAGSLGSGLLMQKTGKYYWLTVLAYAVQCIGSVAIIVTAWLSTALWTSEIGLAVQAVGNGIGLTTTLIAIIANAAPEDQAIATAISYLFRSLGAVLGISIGSVVTQRSLRELLRARLAGEDVDIDKIVELVRTSLASLPDLPPHIRAIVQSSYSEAVRSAFTFGATLMFLACLTAFFIREKMLVRKR